MTNAAAVQDSSSDGNDVEMDDNAPMLYWSDEKAPMECKMEDLESMLRDFCL